MSNGYPISNPNVKKFGELEITGHVVPLSWFKYITFNEKKKRKDAKEDAGEPTGIKRPDLSAIMILADLVYWYRPIRPREETTGKALPWRQKFKADLVQRSYKSYAEQLGLTVTQVTAAMHRLKDLGLIEIVYRNFSTPEGLTLTNVTYFGLNFEKVKAITIDDSAQEEKNEVHKEIPPPSGSTTSPFKIPDLPLEEIPPPPSGRETLPLQEGRPPLSGRETNTETSSEITTENSYKKNFNFFEKQEEASFSYEKEVQEKPLVETHTSIPSPNPSPTAYTVADARECVRMLAKANREKLDAAYTMPPPPEDTPLTHSISVKERMERIRKAVAARSNGNSHN